MRAIQELITNALDMDPDAKLAYADGVITITNTVKPDRSGLTRDSFVYKADDAKQDDVRVTGMFGFGLKDALAILCFNDTNYEAKSSSGRFCMLRPESREEVIQIEHSELLATSPGVVEQTVVTTTISVPPPADETSKHNLQSDFDAAKSSIFPFFKERNQLQLVKSDNPVAGIEVYAYPDNKTPAAMANVLFCHNILFRPGNAQQRKFAFVYHLRMPKLKVSQGRDRLDVDPAWSKFLAAQLMTSFTDKTFLKNFSERYDIVKGRIDNEHLWFAKQTELSKTYHGILTTHYEYYTDTETEEIEVSANICKAEARQATLRQTIQATKAPIAAAVPKDDVASNDAAGSDAKPDLEAESKAALANVNMQAAQESLKKTEAALAKEKQRQEQLRKILTDDKALAKPSKLVRASQAKSMATNLPNVRITPMPDGQIGIAERKSSSSSSSAPGSLAKMVQDQETTLKASLKPCERKIQRMCEALSWSKPISIECKEGTSLGPLADVQNTVGGKPILTLNVRKDTAADELLGAAIRAITKTEDHAVSLIRAFLETETEESPSGSLRHGSAADGAPTSLMMLVIETWDTKKGGIASFNMQLAYDLATIGPPVLVLVTKWTDETDKLAEDALTAGIQLVKPYVIGCAEPLPYLPGRESKVAVIVGHAHITGPLALHISKQPQFEKAKCWIINHCTRKWYNPRKANYDYKETEVKEAELLAVELQADHIWSVGPIIFEYWQNKFAESATYPGSGITHTKFQPTLNAKFVPPDLNSRSNADNNPTPSLLVFGRLDDDEAKGIPCAIAVFKACYHDRSDRGKKMPTLIIRGLQNKTETDALVDKYDLKSYTLAGMCSSVNLERQRKFARTSSSPTSC